MSGTLGAEGHGGGNPGAALSAKTKGARAAAVKPSLYSWTNLDLTVAPPSCPQRPPSHVFLLDQLGQKRSPTPALGAQNQQRGSPRPTPPSSDLDPAPAVKVGAGGQAGGHQPREGRVLPEMVSNGA